jgi:hypothetical protein
MIQVDDAKKEAKEYLKENEPRDEWEEANYNVLK